MIHNFCDENGKCSRCGACCTPFLPMSKNEVKKIENYLKKHLNITKEAYLNNDIKNKTYYVRCCFYKDNKCLIYPVRPLICQMFKCNQTEEKAEINKRFVTSKSAYNTGNPSTLNDFRYLFFEDPINIFIYLKDVLNVKNIEDLKQGLEKMNRFDLVEKLKDFKE